MKTCQNFTVKMDENHKKLHFLAIFFQANRRFQPRALEKAKL
jgi:hypothetical protein